MDWKHMDRANNASTPWIALSRLFCLFSTPLSIIARSRARCLWMTRKRNCFDVSNRDK
jgi:hypothetical protein